jgi:hypothetical protein
VPLRVAHSVRFSSSARRGKQGQQHRVCAFAEEHDPAIRPPNYDAHALPLTAERNHGEQVIWVGLAHQLYDHA